MYVCMLVVFGAASQWVVKKNQKMSTNLQKKIFFGFKIGVKNLSTIKLQG